MAEYCDLVMKGGITSGIIYPKLIAHLSKKYRFKNIGGTSAGAIAAGACAAAEYARRHSNPLAFDSLEQLPQHLSEKVPPHGRSRLLSLFQPTLAARRHFEILVGALSSSTPAALFSVWMGIAGMYKWLLIGGLCLGSLLLWPFFSNGSAPADYWETAISALIMMLMIAGLSTLTLRSAVHSQARFAWLWAVTLVLLIALQVIAFSNASGMWHLLGSVLRVAAIALLFLTLLVALMAGFFVRGLLVALHKNNYGLCSGKSTSEDTPAGQEGLTNWLTLYINELAGLNPTGRPLTFGDLWGHNDEHAPREINLEVMTTAISQQMVYGIPFRDGTPPFYYDPQEWQALFPQQIMDYLNQLSEAQQGSTDQAAVQVTNSSGKALRRLAASADLPIVVAVRMSLSFPVLLSAIPLYAIDWSTTDNAERKRTQRPIVAKRVWFSDGGIGSNMPLHMFDALLPDHPTFGINLKSEHPDHPIQTPADAQNSDGRIYLAVTPHAGLQRFWEAPDDRFPLGGLTGFFSSIINTMQNWRDEIMFTYPGYRDRIVQISLKSNEGGLNLEMPAATIQALGDAGQMAAERLIDRFHSSGGEAGKGWALHQQARLQIFLGAFQPVTLQMAPSLNTGQWNAHLGGYSGAAATLADSFLKSWGQLGNLGSQSGSALDTYAPKPLAKVRLVPKV
ncbi:patatin-like phospholipase family protein [Pseudomonas sp. NY11955]|uniref:patatin-like phospholipase family protein n=1 Tax=Pseudomonas sp. NY11955 TaxID=3400363 RepID=UPI003A894FE9